MSIKQRIKKIYILYVQKDTFISTLVKPLFNTLVGNKFIIKGTENRLNIKHMVRDTRVIINGSENEVMVCGEMNHCQIQVDGNNNRIIIGEDAILIGVEISEMDDGNLIQIGSKCGMQKNTRIISMEGGKIVIGDNCMISYDLEFRNSDAHSILEENHDGKFVRINAPKDIIIGNHVWISQQCLVLKGTEIGDGCIIGAKSLVSNKKYDNNQLIVGTPARVVKSNIRWSEERL